MNTNPTDYSGCEMNLGKHPRAFKQHVNDWYILTHCSQAVRGSEHFGNSALLTLLSHE